MGAFIQRHQQAEALLIAGISKRSRSIRRLAFPGSASARHRLLSGLFRVQRRGSHGYRGAHRGALSSRREALWA